ncbi:MAG: 50S ribosomal protein L15 [Chloroflexi bacterium]|nr:50S ribosomal protein L15 [Chloroflexota bacterium]
MRLHDLAPAPGSRRDRRRVGRGHGSGRGKTSGRGTKGQKSRAGARINPRFEGGQNPMVLRMPHKRGFKNIFRVEYTPINLTALLRFEAGSRVTIDELRAAGLVQKNEERIKILGTGEIDRPLTVVADRFSESARAKIVAAGGTVEALEPAKATAGDASAGTGDQEES